MTSLTEATEHHLTCLEDRLSRAASRHPGRRTPRAGDVRAGTDDFLVAASQHLGAVTAILLPVATRVDGGPELARQFLAPARRLEKSMVRAKAKQYGQAQSVAIPWRQIWTGIHSDLAEVAAAERNLVSRISTALPSEQFESLAERLAVAVRRGPTRPHPYLPHRGLSGRLQRGTWARFDRLWDELEGRVTTPLGEPQAS